MSTTTIRPGLLVALSSSLDGGVTYERVDLDAGQTTDGVAAVARWETTRVIADPAEHERASQARSKATAEIRKVCSSTAFGLLCPEASESELDAAVLKARAIVAEHNAGAQHTKIDVRVFKGRVAATDTEAARAIGAEVAFLIAGMNSAIDRLDPKAIREAANKAREMSAMLSPELSAKVGEAIETARKAARVIVKRVEKDGEAAAVVLADIQRGGIEKARIAFLDLDGDAPTLESPPLPAVNVQRFSGLDLTGAAGDDDDMPPSIDPALAEQARPAVPARVLEVV